MRFQKFLAVLLIVLTSVASGAPGVNNFMIFQSDGSTKRTDSSTISPLFNQVGVGSAVLTDDGSGNLVIPSGSVSQSLANGDIFIGNGSNQSTAVLPSGDWTITNAGVSTISPSAVTNSKIANGTINLTTKVTGTLPAANGGTNSNAALNSNRIMESITGAIVEAPAISPSVAIVSDGNGLPVTGGASATEVGYLSGVTSALQTQLNAKVNSSSVGANNGVASLDSGGKVPVGQLPNSVMELQGVWNATTNSPVLVDGTGNTGDVWYVSVGGTRDLGSGSQTFVVGDYAIYETTGVWKLAHAGSDNVISVNGFSAVVVLTTSNIAEGSNLYYTDARARGALSGTAPVSYNTSTGVISMAPATTGANGYLTSVDWTTFNAKQPTVSATAPITFTSNTIAIPQSGLAANGYLSSGDWTVFNAKQAAGNYITALTSDVTAAGPGSAAATVNSIGGSSSTNVHAAELLANAATNLDTNSAIVRRDGSGNIAVSQLTATSIVGLTTPLSIGQGGTGQATKAAAFDALSPSTTNGDLTYFNGTNNVRLAPGTGTQLLHSGTPPTWSQVSLTADVTGVLPTANGGTGQNSSATYPASGIVLNDTNTVSVSNKTVSALSNTLSNLVAEYDVACDGSTLTFTLSGQNLLATNHVLVYVDGRLQRSGASFAYTTATGSTNQLVFTVAPASTSWCHVVVVNQ